MWSQLLDWAFHWTLLWIAFEVGRRWNEKDVAASIAALTEKQSRRRSQEFTETPEKDRRSPRGSPTINTSPFSTKEKRRLSRPVSSVFSPPGDTSGELRPLIMVDLATAASPTTPTKSLPSSHIPGIVVNTYLHKMTDNISNSTRSPTSPEVQVDA